MPPALFTQRLPATPLLSLIGNTPLVRLNRITDGAKATVAAWIRRSAPCRGSKI